jgi:tetratricopeptide (TPR) repeat protein
MLEDALIELQRRALAERHSEAGSDVVNYRLHDLVFSFTRANTNLREMTVTRACQTFLAKNADQFSMLDSELSNLLGAAERARNNAPDIFLAIMQDLTLGHAYYAARGHSPRSFALHQEVAKLAQDKHSELAHQFLSKLGNSYRELYGNLDKALECYQQALSLVHKLGMS